MSPRLWFELLRGEELPCITVEQIGLQMIGQKGVTTHLQGFESICNGKLLEIHFLSIWSLGNNSILYIDLGVGSFTIWLVIDNSRVGSV